MSDEETSPSARLDHVNEGSNFTQKNVDTVYSTGNT